MGLIDQLQSELKDALVEHQALVLVQVLRKRLDTLTLGDLRTILDSRLGRGLSPILVRDLVASAVPAPQPAAAVPKSTPTRRPRKRSKKSSKGAATTNTASRESAAKDPVKPKAKTKSSAKTKTTASKAPAKGSKRVEGQPPKVSALTVAGREQYDGALAQYLREHPGLNKPRDIRAAVGGTKLQFRSAMQRLEDRGQVQRQGSHSTTTYAAKS